MGFIVVADDVVMLLLGASSVPKQDSVLYFFITPPWETFDGQVPKTGTTAAINSSPTQLIFAPKHHR